MIEKDIRIHDKFSVEIKLGYKTKSSRKINDYRIRTWFFVPNSLDINRDTYSKNQFYNDLKTYIRLSSPVFLLREIAEGENSPFFQLENIFQTFSTNPITKNKEKYEHHLKMFLSILNSSLRNEIEHIEQNEVASDQAFLIKSYLKYAHIILKRFRKIRRIINVPTVTSKHLKIYLLADEYLSNLIEKHSFSLLNILDEKLPEKENKFKAEILALIQEEISYKTTNGCPVIHKDDSDNNGLVIHRRGLLRKFIENQLFLSTRKKKDGAFVEQILYSIAAGLSMIFATIVAFVFQHKFGNFTLPLFVALVVGYMLKDRIKELTRFYLGSKFLKLFFDHKTFIGIDNKQNFGWCKEGFDFVREEKTPTSVLELRNLSRTLNINDIGAFEKIILYRKFTRIYRNKLNRIYKQYNIIGINDIIRFNVSHLTLKMDNPKIPVHYLENEHYETIKVDKLYFLNIILELQENGDAELIHYRMVFNKTGIKHVVKM